MRLTLRQEWRPRALTTFVGYIDIKMGASIALLFAILNKVAGVYGLIAIITGGTLPQLSMYLYSIAGLAAFGWGFKGVSEESPHKTLLTAHVFLVDHLLSTLWTAFFVIQWWIYNPHDGQRSVNSDAQKELAAVGPGHGAPMTDAERLAAAQVIWNAEKGRAAGILAVGWLIKIYFILVLYSYAIHLRKGTYRSLPLSQHKARALAAAAAASDSSYQPIYENELLPTSPINGSNDPQSIFDRPRERDSDFDSSDYDSANDDLERGRRRAKRAVGGSLSVGSYGEFSQGNPSAAAARSTANANANGRISPRGKPNGPAAQSRPIVPSRPLVSSISTNVKSPSLAMRKPSPPDASKTKAAAKGKSREIQKELEGDIDEVAWDDDDSDLSGPGRPSSKGKDGSGAV